MRLPSAACALAALFSACGATGDGGAASAPGDPRPAAAVPGASACNAGRNTGRVVPGHDIVLLQRTLDAGDRLVAELQCDPPDAVVLVLEGPLRPARTEAADAAPSPDPIRWTEFPRPLPPGVEMCPAAGCDGRGGDAWVPPHLERVIADAGDYVLRLEAPEHPATCSVCLRLE